MFLIYRPGDGDEQQWTFKPNKMPSHECEAIEKRTGWTYAEFGVQLQKGSALARRALLWAFLRRQHPVIRFEDLNPAYGEVELEYDAAELETMLAQVEATSAMDADTKAAAVEQIRQQLADARPDPDGPKAPSGN